MPQQVRIAIESRRSSDILRANKLHGLMMGKILLLIVLAMVVLLLWRAAQRRGSGSGGPSAVSPAQQIVACETCSVHMPEAEIIREDGHCFCCPEHRDQFFGRSSRN